LNFAGNHFLELQKAEKFFDTKKANQYGFNDNDYYLMFHTAGFGLEAVANNDFINKYIKKAELIAVKDEDEKKMLFDLYAMLMNFSYAYRLATYLIIKDEITKEFSDDLETIDLISDVPHNSMRFRNDEIIYRRNAVELLDNKLSILAGSYNSASYLVLMGENSNLTYNTSDHGSAEVLKTSQFKKSGTVERILLQKGNRNKIFKTEKLVDYNKLDNPIVNYLTKKK